MDEAALGRVQVLDGIFEGDHVGGPRSVYLADERGERRRLARPGRSVEKHQSVEQGTQRSERARKPQLLQRGNALANGAERHAKAAVVPKEIGAEPAQLIRAVECTGKIRAAGLIEPRAGF